MVIQKIPYKNRITSISYSKSKELFIGLANEGLHIYAFKNKRLYENQWVLRNTSVSSCIKDQMGYWITTIENGIYYIPNFDVFSFTDKMV